MTKIFAAIAIVFLCTQKADAQSFTRIQAENYSAMSGVQTEATQDVDGVQDVGWIDLGDWMDYSITMPTAGMYKVNLRVAASNDGNIVKIKNSAGTLLQQVTLPATWGGQIWTTVTTYITLSQAGTQTIRIESGSSSASFFWNINWFEISTTSVTRVEAEDYTAMSGVTVPEAAWGDALRYGSGDMIVGNIDNGDWMDYSYNAPVAGSYTVNIRTAATNAGGQLQIKSGATVLATVSVPATGGMQTWAWTTPATITLAAGQQTIRVQSSAATNFNLNFFELVAPAGSGGGTNQPPTLNAGVDQSITLPTSQVTLTGTASDVDGTISTYSWTKTSGPASGTITTPSTASTTITGLVQGSYVFRLTVTDNGGATAYDDVTVTVNAAVVTGGWGLGGNAVGDADFVGTTNDKPLVFKANNHSWARLTQLGVLEVNQVKVTASGWADYVFDPSYKLRPLSEVQAYINKHKHLPDVPSAREVKEEGLNVGDNQAVLLRKIEELTLYVISQSEELKKQNEKLEKQNKELKKQSRQISELKKQLGHKK